MKAAVLPAISAVVLGVVTLAWTQPQRDQGRANAPTTAPAARNPGHLKMALVVSKSLHTGTPSPEDNAANLKANLDRHLYFIDRAAAEGADFVGFPELSLNGYHFSPCTTWLRLDGPEVKALAAKAAEKGVYVAAGMAEQDNDGKRWNTHFILGPDGRLVGKHHKIWLTKEKDFVEPGSKHHVFEVKGAKLGIVTCADGTDRKNLEKLAQNGATIIYGPHANTTGGTSAGWYKFRAAWGGEQGWVAGLKVYAALHNHAGLFNPDYQPPAGAEKDSNAGWAAGAWFIGPDGKTLAQTPPSTNKGDSKETILMYSIPLAAP